MVKTKSTNPMVSTDCINELLGDESVRKIIKHLVEDKTFIQRIAPFVDQNSFKEPYQRIMVGIILDNYQKTGMGMSYDGLKLIVRGQYDSEMYQCVCEYIDDYLKEEDSVDRDIYEEQAIKYFQTWKMIKLFNSLGETIVNGDLETLKKKTKKMTDTMIDINCSLSEQPYIQSKDMVEKVLQENEDRVPVGFTEIDELTGGCSKGSIALWTAFRGQGKTTISIAISAEMAKLGYNVLYFNGEDNPIELTRKVFAHQTVLPIQTFTEKGSRYLSQQHMEIIKSDQLDHLYLSKMKTGQWTEEDFEQAIKIFINKYGIRPDVVVLDYLSCLKMSSNPIKNEWKAEEDCMRKLENLAQEYNIILHIFEQAKDTPSMEDAKKNDGCSTKGSIAKEQIASYIFRLFRTKEQMRNNRADLEINKVRDGNGSGTIFENFLMDNEKVTIDLSTSNTVTYDEKLIYDDNE